MIASARLNRAAMATGAAQPNRPQAATRAAR